MNRFGLTLDEVARFHGHRGPWLIIVYKAGSRAREVLRPLSEHDLLCIARIPKKIPYTCPLDGIQASAGCTLGKLSILIEESNDLIEYIFINRRTGKKLILRLRREIVNLIEKVYEEKELEEAAKYAEVIDLCKLFEEYLS